jgi:hypothetical protein
MFYQEQVIMKGTAPQEPRLLDQVRNKIRLKHYSIRTEQAYVDWIKRFILFHDKRHPKDMGAREVEQFLTHLATERNVASSTQNQALSAILFLYREVLSISNYPGWRTWSVLKNRNGYQWSLRANRCVLFWLGSMERIV